MNDRECQIVHWALDHFYNADMANAAIHIAPVKFSPITFELAILLHKQGSDSSNVLEILSHTGKYEPDKGR